MSLQLQHQVLTATMLTQCRQSAVPIYLRIAGAGPNGSELRTKIQNLLVQLK